MGKGLAYRFRQHYPLNFEHYALACQRGQVHIGHILFFSEEGKTIANFPTKDRWREDSRYEYIEAGLVDLKSQLISRTIASVALPPLGCGNGALEWCRVKPIIERHMADLDAHVYLHTPLNELPSAQAAGKLGAAHLVLMRLKGELAPFTHVRLHAAAALVDALCGKKLFDLEGQLDTLCWQIRVFQQTSGVSTARAQTLLHGRLTSAALEASLSKSDRAVTVASALVNSLHTDHEIELASAVVRAHKQMTDATADQVAASLWHPFAADEVRTMISRLQEAGVLERTLLGFRVKDLA